MSDSDSVQLNTRVRPDVKERLKKVMKQEDMSFPALLEVMLEIWERDRKPRSTRVFASAPAAASPSPAAHSPAPAPMKPAEAAESSATPVSVETAGHPVRGLERIKQEDDARALTAALQSATSGLYTSASAGYAAAAADDLW